MISFLLLTDLNMSNQTIFNLAFGIFNESMGAQVFCFAMYAAILAIMYTNIVSHRGALTLILSLIMCGFSFAFFAMPFKILMTFIVGILIGWNFYLSFIREGDKI